MELGRLLRTQEILILALVIVFSTIITIVNPSFFSFENLFDLVRSNSGVAILAVGIFIVLLSGGIDVSSTTIAIAGQYIAVNVLLASGINSIALAFLVSIGVGVALGAINALFVSLLNIPTLIVTLGTSSLFHGALLEFVGSRSINSGNLPSAIKDFGRTNIIPLTRANGSEYGLSVFFLIAVAVIVLTWYILKYTMLGRGIYAIGGNQEAAERVGFNIKKIKFFIYCYSGFLAGIMGVMHVALIRTANPQYLVGSELSIIAAVVIGGARLTGGVGTMAGTILGVVLVTILEKNLVLLGLPSYWQKFFIGAVLIIGVVITYGEILTKKRKGAASGARPEIKQVEAEGVR